MHLLQGTYTFPLTHRREALAFALRLRQLGYEYARLHRTPTQYAIVGHDIQGPHPRKTG